MRAAVIGASSGLGAALALSHHSRGDDVIATARRRERLSHLRTYSTSEGAPWQSVGADISTDVGFATTVDAVRAADRIYLCAATNSTPTATVAVNLVAPIRIAEAVDRRGLQVVVLSSLTAVVAFPTLGTYGATKAGLEHWVASHRQRCLADVLLVRPGQFQSEFHTGPAPFDHASLPHQRAAQVIAACDHRRSGTVTMGGYRDKVAATASRVLGPVRSLRLL